MDCINKSDLQAYIDNELNKLEKEKIKSHLENCKNCRKAFNELKDNNNYVSKVLSEYRESTDRISELKEIPHFQYREETISKKKRFAFIQKYKKAVIAASIVVLIATGLIVPPIRAALSEFLSIFRVENIEGINMTLEELHDIQNQIKNHVTEIDLKEMGNIKIKGGKERWISKKDAGNLTDFPVLFLVDQSFNEPKIQTTDPTTINFTLDIHKINKIFQSFAAEKLLPEDLDGRSFTIQIPRTIKLEYLIDGSYLKIFQARSPELNVPPDINVEEIYNSLIELPLLPKDLQRQLSSIKDWRNTIYIPIIKSKIKEVDINGNKGYAGSVSDLNPNNMVMWQKNGIFYCIEGSYDTTHLIELAKSMR